MHDPDPHSVELRLGLLPGRRDRIMVVGLAAAGCLALLLGVIVVLSIAAAEMRDEVVAANAPRTAAEMRFGARALVMGPEAVRQAAEVERLISAGERGFQSAVDIAMRGTRLGIDPRFAGALDLAELRAAPDAVRSAIACLDGGAAPVEAWCRLPDGRPFSGILAAGFLQAEGRLPEGWLHRWVRAVQLTALAEAGYAEVAVRMREAAVRGGETLEGAAADEALWRWVSENAGPAAQAPPGATTAAAGSNEVGPPAAGSVVALARSPGMAAVLVCLAGVLLGLAAFWRSLRRELSITVRSHGLRADRAWVPAADIVAVRRVGPDERSVKLLRAGGPPVVLGPFDGDAAELDRLVELVRRVALTPDERIAEDHAREVVEASHRELARRLAARS